jgi:tRNA (guanine-N7-)-methyltransferase
MRKKLVKFQANHDAPNVLEMGKPLYETIKGKWREEFFKNTNPVCLELACGRGEYTVGQARLFPERNYVGVDIKGDRIWKGSSAALEEGLTNVGFVRTQILLLEKFFDACEVEEIWIVFPDPRPRDRDEKRRLTHPRFLEMYKRIARPDAWIRLKTDNTGLFEYTLEVLKSRTDIRDLEFTFDLYHSELLPEAHGIRTKYEHLFEAQGHDIKYLKFRFKTLS